ncbi:MAG: transposase family protein [Prevotellaceae bacterium]|nr:transposase family protein [Prevotellaceae bacterium]
MKNNIICSPEKQILWLSQTFDGSVHDKKKN